MRRGIWHSATVAAALIGLVAVAPPSAAGPPYEEVFRGTDVYCFSSVEETTIEVGAFFLPSGELDYAYGGVYTEEAGVWSEFAEGRLDQGEISLELAFVDDVGDPAGTLVLGGTVMPMGDPFTIDESFRDGNVLYRISGTVQELIVEAGITDATGDLEGLIGTPLTCGGSEVDVVQWSTNPATRIYRGSGAGAYCELGEDGILSVDVWGDEAYGFVALGIDWDNETADLIAEGPLGYVDSSITGELMVVEPPTDPMEYVGVDLQVGSTVLYRGTNRGKSRNGAFMERYVRYALTGSVTTPDGEVIVIQDCLFSTYSYKERYSSRAGQKPGGNPPANDLPDDALMLSAGGSYRTSTRGATPPPEAPCMIEYEGDLYEVPFGRTVWYAFEGTGSDVTVSTAGSGFDTVLGVYDPGLAPLACVDDVFSEDDSSLQAEVTVATEPGATYLVQVGGFGFPDDPMGPDFGNLVTTRS